MANFKFALKITKPNKKTQAVQYEISYDKSGVI